MISAGTKTVVVCDLQPVAIEGVRGVLSATPDLRFADSVATLDGVIEVCRSLSANVALVDKALGLSLITSFLGRLNIESGKTAAVVWGTGIKESEALRLVQAGARGVLRRSADSTAFLHCLRSVSDGNIWLEDAIFGDSAPAAPECRPQLTPRENEVARLVEKGLRNREIARDLGIQTDTVKLHLHHIFKKTGVRGRGSLALSGLKERAAITILQ